MTLTIVIVSSSIPFTIDPSFHPSLILIPTKNIPSSLIVQRKNVQSRHQAAAHYLQPTAPLKCVSPSLLHSIHPRKTLCCNMHMCNPAFIHSLGSLTSCVLIL